MPIVDIEHVLQLAVLQLAELGAEAAQILLHELLLELQASFTSHFSHRVVLNSSISTIDPPLTSNEGEGASTIPSKQGEGADEKPPGKITKRNLLKK